MDVQSLLYSENLLVGLQGGSILVYIGLLGIVSAWGGLFCKEH